MDRIECLFSSVCFRNQIPDEPIAHLLLVLAFQAYHKIALQYICDLITIKKSNRTLRYNNQMLLVVLLVKLDSYGS